MQRNLSWDDDGGIVAKADKVAAKLSECVPCDGVYISLANRNRLFSFGMTGADGPDDEMRSHNAADTICGVTITKNKRQILSDARKVDGLSNISYVSQGHIVGYLGQPIRDAEANAIGAICAISTKPRIWSETDKLNLQMSCIETEYLLATELLQREMVYLSQALGEYDNIITSLTNNIKLMTSVHSESGELLFATKSLLEEVDASCLEDAYHQYLENSDVVELSESSILLHQNADVPGAPELMVRGNCKKAKNWQATVQKNPGSVSFVSWKPA